MKKPQVPTIILEVDPISATAEAYRTLRTNIQFAGLDQAYRKLLFTSATPGEGKTTTVANLGVAMAESGRRICMIDADLRHSTLHHYFGLPNTNGLTVALTEAKSMKQVVLPTMIPNLSLVPSGPPPPNPSQLLGSNRMRQFVDLLGGEFDMLLFDSPPVISMSDAPTIATLTDGVILVLKTGAVPRDLARRATEQIEAVKAKVIGVLLNQVDPRRDGYYYRYFDQYYNSYNGHEK